MAQQTSLTPLPTHTDLLTTVLPSPSGRRLLTASLDHTVRISSRSATTGSWDVDVSQWKAHDAPVLCASWAPRQWGQVIATGGADGVVNVWVEEAIPAKNKEKDKGKRWALRASLTDPRGTVRAIGFAPAELGLKLAAVASDGHVRVWESLDASTGPRGLREWTLVEDLDVAGLPIPSGPTSDISTSPETRTLGPNASSSSLGQASATSAGERRQQLSTGTIESDGGWALSWCGEHWWGARLAVSAGTSGFIRILHLPDQQPAQPFLTLFPPTSAPNGSHPSSSSHSSPSSSGPSPVSSLAWAPASGRSYQLLATGSRDGTARIWKLHPPTPPSFPSATTSGSDEVWTAELDAELFDATEKASATGAVKVAWNLTGSVLSTAGEDAKVRLWKQGYTGQWRTVAVLRTDERDKGDRS